MTITIATKHFNIEQDTALEVTMQAWIDDISPTTIHGFDTHARGEHFIAIMLYE